MNPIVAETFYGGGGDEYIELVDNQPGWRVLSSYGAFGWDAGNWPLVVFAVRDTDPLWSFSTYVEGDIRTETYHTEQDRNDALDLAIAWFWRQNPDRYGKEVAEVVASTPEGEQLPAKFRGFFSWSRTDEV